MGIGGFGNKTDFLKSSYSYALLPIKPKMGGTSEVMDG
jgi:hypothetical protein